MLLVVVTHYHLTENVLCYADNENDLGVVINSTLNFSEHCGKLLFKANQQNGLLKRTCYFVSDLKRRRVLYLTLGRISQFEHSSQVWRPCCKTMIPMNLRFCAV